MELYEKFFSTAIEEGSRQTWHRLHAGPEIVDFILESADRVSAGRVWTAP